MKACNGCGISKPLEAFCRTKAQPDGRERRCRGCRAVYRERNREKIAAKKAADYLANRDRERAKRKRNREENPEAAAARFARWKAKNPERFKEHQLAYRRANVARKAEYERANAAWRCASQSARRARQIRATPKWADLEKVAEFYRMAALVRQVLSQPQHVDHIVPLKSSFVCGLHNEFNLQILPATVNIAKGNRTWPDMC